MYKLASFFAGVGGIDLGFARAGCSTVYANEFDLYAGETFALNFQGVGLDPRDIRDVKPEDIPDSDIIAGGFPCQAFSIAGLRQGFDDEKGRGNLFFELARIIKAKKPRVAFFENVKNLVSHDNGNTFKVICNTLSELGYKYTYKVMNACEYGNIPQNRERIYIIAFRDEKNFDKFSWPEPYCIKTKIKNIIDFENRVDEKYYYRPDKYTGNIYDELEKAARDDDIDNPAVYQWRRVYVRKNKSGVVPTLTANMGGGGHNVPIVKTTYGIRKLTPRECFSVQGFPIEFRLPEQSDARLYKQAGNSVCVPVIERIAEAIIDAMR